MPDNNLKVKHDLLLTGVGGQGTILSSDVLGETAISAGLEVKKTDVHGMAQRGGSVTSHVRIGRHIYSPLINEGDADLLLAFEKLEAARWAHFLRPGGVVIINDYAQPPLSVSMGETYPTDDQVLGLFRPLTGRVFLVPGTRLAREMGDVRVLNILMLGCASGFLPFTPAQWQETIAQLVPEKVRSLNLAAFERGREEMINAGR
jgi:indolepyruvate ferredoxin oxidoreductase beta subunit